MNKLVLVFIFCLAQQTLVECIDVVDGKSHNNNSSGSIQAIVTNKLLAFKNKVHLLVEKGIDRVENNGNNTVDTGLKLKLNCTHIIQTAAKESEKTIFSMVENATKDGKEASHCNKTVTSDNIIKELNSCVKTNIDHCRSYVARGIKLIRDFLKISEKIDGDVKDCGVGLKSIRCNGLVLAKVAAETAVVVGKAANVIKDVIASILFVKSKFVICQVAALTSSAVEFGKLITETAICIEKCECQGQ